MKVSISRNPDAQGNSPLVETLRELSLYLEYDLKLDVEYLLVYIIGPLVLAGIIMYGSLGFLGDVYRWIVPPKAPELHRSALAALHYQKRIHRDDKIHYREAEALLLRAIAKDDLYFPAYLSLASLYIYRMKCPTKALEILAEAKDRGPMAKVEPLWLDAKALQTGGNDHMIQAGGAIFAEQDYLSTTQLYDKPT